MARTSVLAVLHPPRDVDYVGQFQKLADTSLQIRRQGPTYGLMVQRSILEAAIGNYDASRRTAYDASLMRHQPIEAHYQRGCSAMLQALCRIGAVEAMVGGDDGPSIRALLREGVASFEDVLAIDAEDEDAHQLLDACHEWLDAHANMATTMREALASPGDKRPPRPSS